MIDPLSALSAAKKKETPKAKPAAPKPAASSISPLGGIGDVSSLTDVSAALGGARRSATGTAPLFQHAKTTPDLDRVPSPPPQQQLSDADGLASVIGQQSSGSAPVPAAAGGATTFEDILEGEKVAVLVKKCFLKVANPLCEVPGRLLCTNYRLKFQNVKGGLKEEMRWMVDSKFFEVPMGTLEDLKVDSKTTVTGAMEVTLRITTKDCRLLNFLMTSEEECRDVLSAVSSFGHPGNPTLLFAVKYCEEYRKCREPLDVDGWTLYDPIQEYARMGIDTDISPNPSCPWKVSPLNTTYQLCSTYPHRLVLPRRMGDQELRAVAGFRKRGRLPALSWCGGAELNYAAVFRCSQTTEGLMGQKCPEDENHVRCIRDGPRRDTERDLLVIDLRPWKAAWANKAGGGGFEGYDHCNLIFGGIDNIHCVRDAWKGMVAACQSVSDGEVGAWFKNVAESYWYDYIGAIMSCARKVVVEILEMKSNVMVHCSDGWDRTAQTTSLAMLCIDPHYRTQAGFLTLIQKEWCSFGHKFRTRLALGEAPTSEASPVFVQWLEAVYQVVIQNPNIFEFSTSVLLRIGSEASSNRYGTFLTDCERERVSTVAPHTLSLWSILLSPSERASWRNPGYQRSEKPFVPAVSQACFQVWEDYWFRYQARGQKLRASQARAHSLTQGSGLGSASGPEVASPALDPLGGGSTPKVVRSGSPGANRSSAILNPLNPLAPAAPVAPVAPAEPAPVERPPPAEPVSLFTPEEVVAAPKAKPKTYFNDDDDDDIFANKK